MCRAQATSSSTGIADLKLQQRPAIQLPKMEEEGLKGISSKCIAQQPRTSTPTEGDRSMAAEAESMEVDTPAEQAASKDSSANVVAHPATQGLPWSPKVIISRWD